jgi:hypothetical protein
MLAKVSLLTTYDARLSDGIHLSAFNALDHSPSLARAGNKSRRTQMKSSKNPRAKKTVLTIATVGCDDCYHLSRAVAKALPVHFDIYFQSFSSQRLQTAITFQLIILKAYEEMFY